LRGVEVLFAENEWRKGKRKPSSPPAFLFVLQFHKSRDNHPHAGSQNCSGQQSNFILGDENLCAPNIAAKYAPGVLLLNPARYS
jgi:hypothetical protein